MNKKILILCSLISTLSSAEYKYNCKVPDILMETIKLTENEKLYPYFIRTNDSKQLEKFNSISKKFNIKKTNDDYVVDCLDVHTCSSLTKELILNGITNIDLGLFQINFDSFPRRLDSYFVEKYAYQNACSAVIEKVKIAKRWDWDVLAGYHSFTPSKNKIYKEKLMNNFIKLSKN